MLYVAWGKILHAEALVIYHLIDTILSLEVMRPGLLIYLSYGE